MSNIFDGLFKHNGVTDMNSEMDIPSDYDTSELMVSKIYFARNVYSVFRKFAVFGRNNCFEQCGTR